MCVAKDYDLTEKQFLFCQEYIKCNCNGSNAYKNIYPNCKPENARTFASRLIAKDNVKACIEKLLEEVQFNKKAIISECVMNLIDIAKGNAEEETEIKTGEETKKVKNKTANRDRLEATEKLLKLFNAYDTTTSNEEDEEIETIKGDKEEAKQFEVDGLEDE